MIMHNKKIRYAVVGLGWIVQEAVLPAFANAKENCQLTALVSDDPKKLEELGKKYKVTNLYSYKEYEDCLNSGEVDAVFIGLPNHLHCEYTVKAAQAGVHVLCEKPMAITEEECKHMIEAARRNKVKLMIAYRLHFEEGNLKVIDHATNGDLGDVRIFNSTFTMDVEEGNIRLEQETGGGTLYDIGIYCINAARGIFRAEPSEVMAMTTKGKERRFKETDEMSGALLRFPHDQIATLIVSFGAAKSSAYEIFGTKGSLRVDPAFSHNAEIRYVLKRGEKEEEKKFPPRDHFGPELVHFSDCIIRNKDLEPSGTEGLADVRIIEALYESARTHAPVKLAQFHKAKRPHVKQTIKKPNIRKPNLVHAKNPSRHS